MRGARVAIAAAVGLIAVAACSAAVAAPKPTPAPTPPPPVPTPPVYTPPANPGPTAVPNGASGADLLTTTGHRTKAPTVPPPTTTGTSPTPPPATTPTGTEPAPGTTTAAVVPPAGSGTPPTAAGDPGSDTVLPRDGVIVLVGVLLVGLAVALRAIRGRERRVGLALLAFCLAYLVVLGGLVFGVAGV